MHSLTVTQIIMKRCHYYDSFIWFDAFFPHGNILTNWPRKKGKNSISLGKTSLWTCLPIPKKIFTNYPQEKTQHEVCVEVQ